MYSSICGLVRLFILVFSFYEYASAQINLGSAASYGIIAATDITNTGATEVDGLLGISPNDATSITGFPPGTAGGVNAGNSAADNAREDASTAYSAAASMDSTGATGSDLGGQVLVQGVYTSASAVGLNGALVLDGQGNPNAIFVFQIGTTLTTSTASSVVLINGAQACNVFWQVGSSATLGAATVFAGNIVALTSISVNAGVTTTGGLYALNGAVTLINDRITAQKNCVLVLPSSSAVVVSSSVVSSSVVSSSVVSTSVVSSSLVSSFDTAMSTSATMSTSIDVTTNTLASSSSSLSVFSSSPSSSSSALLPSSLPGAFSSIVSVVSPTSSLAIISTSSSTTTFATSTAAPDMSSTTDISTFSAVSSGPEISTVSVVSSSVLASQTTSVVPTTSSTILPITPSVSSTLDSTTSLTISEVFPTSTTTSPTLSTSALTRSYLTISTNTKPTPILPSPSTSHISRRTKTTFRTHILTSKHPHAPTYSRPPSHTCRPKVKPEHWKPKAVASKAGNPAHEKTRYGDGGCGGRKAREGGREISANRGEEPIHPGHEKGKYGDEECGGRKAEEGREGIAVHRGKGQGGG